LVGVAECSALCAVLVTSSEMLANICTSI
jgi:hypothetical protein